MGIFERMLLEAKIDKALEASKLSDEDKDRVRELNDRLTNKTKYVDYLIKYFNEQDIVELIEEFDNKFRRLEKKDINQYTIEQLRDALKLAGKSRSQEKSEIKSEGADLVHENEKAKVYKITSSDASCLYGAGTKWCISAKNQNMFEYYDKDNNIYFVIPKDGSDKYAITSGDKLTVYNAADRVVSFDRNIKTKFGITKEVFKPITREDKIQKFLSKLTKNPDGTYSSDGDVTIIPELVG